MMQILTEGETRTGQGQEIKSLEALLRDRAKIQAAFIFDIP